MGDPVDIGGPRDAPGTRAPDRPTTPREAMLQNELQHRVRNILATVRSIFHRTFVHAEDMESAADHFRGRLDSLAHREGALARWPEGRVDLESLVRDEFSSFQFGDLPGITITGPEVFLGRDESIALGLAIHELVTNSLKFGALATMDERGRLAIDWTVDDDWLRLEWRETGVAIVVSAPVRYGFGREFIEQGLPYQIDADTSFELSPGGVRCTIAVPLKHS